MILAPYELVQIEWEDSQQPHAPWGWADDFELPSPIVCRSVGFVIARTDEAIALAPNLGDLAWERIQVSGVIRIPTSAIRSTTALLLVAQAGEAEGRNGEAGSVYEHAVAEGDAP